MIIAFRKIVTSKAVFPEPISWNQQNDYIPGLFWLKIIEIISLKNNNFTIFQEAAILIILRVFPYPGFFVGQIAYKRLFWGMILSEIHLVSSLGLYIYNLKMMPDWLRNCRSDYTHGIEKNWRKYIYPTWEREIKHKKLVFNYSGMVDWARRSSSTHSHSGMFVYNNLHFLGELPYYF